MSFTTFKAEQQDPRSAHLISSPRPSAELGYSTPAAAVNLYRLPQVLKRIPVSRSAWFAGILTGRFPRGYSLGPRTTVWKSDEIDQIVAALSHQVHAV
jgi:predicted DNA-binding transcriptional regulator AlpA